MKIQKILEYNLCRLTRENALEQINNLIQLANLIPLVDYSKDMILRETKGSTKLYGKWEHSLAVYDNNEIIAFLIAYEREAEDNDQYPVNSLYINELAVNNKYQKKGIGTQLLKIFIDVSKREGFKYLNGPLIIRVQTNSATSNLHVQKLYENLDFKKVSHKEYTNRTDNIYQLIPVE